MVLLSLYMQDGYRDILKLADNFTAFNQRLKYAHYRPPVSLKSDPMSWWKYAYKAVSDQMKKARYLNKLTMFLVFLALIYCLLHDIS